MKAVILAGGLGTRLSEETSVRPKPMVEIGGLPILWHILKLYSQQGINDFIICLGYKGYIIKEYFANYFLHTSDVTFDVANNKMTVHDSVAEPWHVTLVDTGDDSGTGGRLRRVAKYLDPDEPFCMTYGDGVADVDIQATIAFHKAHGKQVTLTSVQPVARFGALGLKDTHVYAFQEKPQDEGGWINGGFFVLSPKVIAEVKDDRWMFEREPIESLVAKGEVQAFFHHGFWQAMDTLRDKQQLEELWASGKAPWKSCKRSRKVEIMTNKRKVSLTIVFGIALSVLVAIFFSPLQAIAWHCTHGNHIDLAGARLTLPLLWWPKDKDSKGTVEIAHAKAGQISFLEGLRITPLSPDKIKSREEFLDNWNKFSARYASSHIKTLRPVELQTRDFTLYCMRDTVQDEIVVCWSPDLRWSIGYMGLHGSAKEAESIISSLEKSR